LGASQLPSLAVDFNWNVAGPANWADGANWNPVGPPSGGGGNHALVNNGGTAEISADILDIQDIFVGAGVGNTGTLNQTAGNTFQGTGSWMFIGQDGGTGTYNLSGGSQNKERLYVGRNNSGFGTLNLSGTGLVDTAEVNLGVDGNPGLYAVGNANISNDGRIQTSGLFQVSNGAVDVTDNGSIDAAGEFWVGQGEGRTATLTMDSGVAESDSWIAIGRESGTGTVTLSGSAVLRKVGNAEHFITLGGLGAGGGGTINLSGNASIESISNMVLSETAGRYGIVNQSGGSVTIKDNTISTTFTASLEMDSIESEYHLSGGSLLTETIDAGIGNFDMTGGTLVTTVFNGDLTVQGGALDVADTGILGSTTVNGGFDLFAAGDVKIEIDGLSAGIQHDQIIVNGAVALAGLLDINLLTYVPSNGDQFTILLNDDVDAVSGTFAGLAEGATFLEGATTFQITYAGGDGNDVVLTAVPEPSTVAVLFGGLALLAMRRRRA
jgi:hypothetical protein